MARNTLIVVSACLIGLFAILYFKARQTVSVNEVLQKPAALTRPAISTAPSPSAQASRALPSVKGLTTNSAAIRRDLQRDIEKLRAELAERRRRLQDRSAALARLRNDAEENDSGTTGSATEAAANDGAAERSDGNTSNASETTGTDPAEQIRVLSADLAEMRATREAIRREEEDAIQIRENANRLEIARIETALQQAEDAQEATRRELDRWSRDHAFVNGEPAHNSELETRFAEQQQQIETLRAQRLALTTDLHVQADTIYNLSQQARDQLRSEEQEVRRQIFSLQNEIRRIQRSQVQERMSRQTQATQWTQAQRAYQSEAQAVRQLEASLQSKQEELRKLE